MTPSSGSPPLHGKRILVVEDDTDTLDLFCFILETAGAQPIAAEGVAVALAASGSFDLILCDVSMPVTSGLEAIAMFRQRWGAVPVMGVSAGATLEHRLRALEAGFCRYLVKPIEPPELVETARLVVQEVKSR